MIFVGDLLVLGSVLKELTNMKFAHFGSSKVHEIRLKGKMIRTLVWMF